MGRLRIENLKIHGGDELNHLVKTQPKEETMNTDQTLMQVVDGTIEFSFIGESSHYWIDMNEITEPADLLRWVRQLSEKSWMSRRLLLAFIREVSDTNAISF